MQKNKPLDKSHKTGQTLRTKIAFYSGRLLRSNFPFLKFVNIWCITYYYNTISLKEDVISLAQNDLHRSFVFASKAELDSLVSS
ncbi:hypothetical protein Hanom_Chr07g00599241 [Helianthus anomalus]